MPARCPRSVPLLAGALLVVSACTATAATDGAVPIDKGTFPVVTSAPPPSSSTTTADVPPATSPASVVAAVDSLLGGQATISRPVNDDGTRPAVRDDRVFILGDSIIEAAGPDNYDTLRRQLTPLGWKVTIDAQKGRSTQQGVTELEKHRRDIHDVVVILLGHNDPVDPLAYRKKIDEMVDLLAGVPLVMFLTNYEFQPGRDRMNDVLRVVDALHDNVELVDWNAVAENTKGAIGPDGLHPTELGAKALAATVAVSLGVAPDGPATTGGSAGGS
jgi:lysophospholipase L1-like esterase